MKKMKKLASIMLALVMTLAMTLPVMAGEQSDPPGKMGSITIKDSETVSVSGRTFNAYQVLTAELVNNEDATEGIVYRVPDVLVSFYAEQFELTDLIGKNGFDEAVTQAIGAMKDDAEALEAFAKAVLDAAKKDNNITPVSVTGAEGVNSVTISNLPLGYYVVEDTGVQKPVSAVALTTTDTDADVTLKADEPKIDKYIDAATDTDETNDGDTDGLVKNNNEAIGDKVPYVVRSVVPDMTGYTKYYFVVNDTLSKGLTFNNDVKITITGTNAEADDVDDMAMVEKTLDKNKDYTVEVSEDGRNVEIVFNSFIQYKNIAGAEITITYSATINEDAVIGNLEGNVNKVQLTYSNNPNTNFDSDPENPNKPENPDVLGKTPESTTRTFVTGLQLKKVDPNGDFLPGAEFKITGTKLNTVLVTEGKFEVNADGNYWKLKDKEEYTTTPPTEESAALYEDVNTKYKETVVTTVKKKEGEAVEATGTVAEDTGILVFKGLAEGTYIIKEIKAPNGYNLLQNDIEVKITCTISDDDDETVNNCTWTAEITSGADGANEGLVEKVAADDSGMIKINVTNKSGSLLPSTGGIGTTIFYIIGGVLVLGAAILLITKKRMSREA